MKKDILETPVSLCNFGDSSLTCFSTSDFCLCKRKTNRFFYRLDIWLSYKLYAFWNKIYDILLQ